MLTELGQQNKKLNISPRFMSRTSILSVLTLIFAGISVVNADDTEIFTAGVAPPPDSSNVVFMIDTSGSMNNSVEGDASGISKIQMVKNVFEQLIFETDSGTNTANPAMQGLKMALMRFDNGANNSNNANGGYFIHDLRTLNNGSVEGFWTVINGLSAGGFTPLAETAFEAARFFKAETPHFTNTSPGQNVPGVLAGGYYKSPFKDGNQSQCGINNHLVILTDGLPTRDGDADTLINALPNTTDDCVFSEASNTDCLPQVAEHLYAGDLFPDDVFPDKPGDQKVMTHTIAFDLRDESAALALLQQTAENGGGLATNANNAAELAQAIENILAEIPESAVSMVSPAVSVDSLNQFVHDNTVYIGMFKPQTSPLWPGNLKGYQYNFDGELYDFSATPQPALDGNVFAANARSKWSSAIDAGNVEQGGAAEQILAQPSRSIFTQNSTNPSASTLVTFSVANENNIPAGDFGDGITNDQKIEIIQWATSRDELPIGDPLHSQPIMIDFGGDTGSVIFFGTNQGFLHAISATTGQELMAFIPKSLLSNLQVFRNNNTQDAHPYGLDGHISYYRHDENGDGQIRAIDNDKVLVIVGMRRGGNEFFALDVTNLNSPTQAWHITGGDGDFADMGDSWSKPIITEMNFGNSISPTRERVALIGGGYDTQYDELNNEITNPAGAALFAVDLETGECLWSASDSASGCTNHTTVAGMTHSFPSHIAAIDLTADNVVDRLYAIDIMGHIFRLDFNFTDDDGDYVFSGQMFANLSSGTRRFYYGVDVAYTEYDFTDKLHLSVGSGHRAHPLAADSGDVVASVWDVHVGSPLPSGFTTITADSLSNLTSLDAEIAAGSLGWYFNLSAGEKILSIASSLGGYVFLTSYSPPNLDAQSNSCEVQYGSGNVYAVKLSDASPLDPTNPQANGRAIAIPSTGISSGVAFMTLHQPESTSDATNPLASQDTEVFAMVNGRKLLLTQLAQQEINKSMEATKSYWYIGEPPQ